MERRFCKCGLHLRDSEPMSSSFFFLLYETVCESLLYLFSQHVTNRPLIEIKWITIKTLNLIICLHVQTHSTWKSLPPSAMFTFQFLFFCVFYHQRKKVKITTSLELSLNDFQSTVTTALIILINLWLWMFFFNLWVNKVKGVMTVQAVMLQGHFNFLIQLPF